MPGVALENPLGGVGIGHTKAQAFFVGPRAHRLRAAVRERARARARVAVRRRAWRAPAREKGAGREIAI
jgi:hypothetical protein